MKADTSKPCNASTAVMGLLPCFILLLKTLEELGQLGFGFVTQGLLLCDKLLQVASMDGNGYEI